MDVKVKASIVRIYDHYDCTEKYNIRYTYKAKGFGFKKINNSVGLIWRYSSTRETQSDYDKRIIKVLSELTREDVIEKVKDSIIKDLMFRVASNTVEEEKKRLLKELNNIKFNFTIKDRL
jgi:hypothetical protein